MLKFIKTLGEKVSAAYDRKVTKYGIIVALLLIIWPLLTFLSDLAQQYQWLREKQEAILAILNNRNYTMPGLFIIATILILLNRRQTRIRQETLWKDRYDRLVTLASKQKKGLGSFVYADQIRCTHPNSFDGKNPEIRFHIRVVNASLFNLKIDPNIKGRINFNRARLAGPREFDHTDYEIESLETNVIHFVQQLTPDDRDLIKEFDGNLLDAFYLGELKIEIRPAAAENDQRDTPAYITISPELKLQRD